MTHKKPTIKLNDSEYDLKITLGFWKDLSFSRKEIGELRNDAKRMLECLELAIFHGNKKKFGWDSLSDMDKLNIKKSLEDLEVDPYDLLDNAFYHYLPDNLKKMADKIESGELNQDNLKKK